MSTDAYVPLISALVGALIGASASIVTVIVQARFQNKRELTKEALTVAVDEWKTRLELVKDAGGAMLPLAVFVNYNVKLIRLAESGRLSPETLRALGTENDALIQHFVDAKNERAAVRKARSTGD